MVLATVNWGQAIADAIALGALYGLVAVGIGLVFGVLRLVNFAYGELITLGAYILAFTYGWPRVVSILLCIAAVVALALAQEFVAFRPMRRSGASPATMLVATFALSFLLQAIYLIAFGSRGQIVGTLGRLNSAFTIAGVDIRWIPLVGVVVGGIERLWSAAAGGFVVGLVYGLLSDALSSTSSVYLPAVVYGLVIVVLLLRPAGLFRSWRAQQVERV